MISKYPTRDELEDFRDEVDELADKIMEMVAGEQPDAGVAMCALTQAAMNLGLLMPDDEEPLAQSLKSFFLDMVDAFVEEMARGGGSGRNN
jgi:hypothetical protein